MINFYLTLFLVVTVFGTTTALECYQCDSRTDASCKEHLDESDRRVLRSSTCTTNAAEFCVKTTGVWGECNPRPIANIFLLPTNCCRLQKNHRNDFMFWTGAVGTTRFCSSRDMFNQCQYVKYADHDRIYRACIYTCKGDGCNSAMRDRLSWMTLIGLNLIVLFFTSKLF